MPEAVREDQHEHREEATAVAHPTDSGGPRGGYFDCGVHLDK